MRVLDSLARCCENPRQSRPIVKTVQTKTPGFATGRVSRSVRTNDHRARSIRVVVVVVVVLFRCA
jgi:hypothetical protein